MAEKKNKKSGVEPFEPEDEVEAGDDENENDESEDDVSKETAKAKSRRAREAEAEEEDDEDEDDDETTDEVEDEDDDEVEEDDEFALFKPFIVHEEQEWELDDVLGNADGGEVVILYHLESGHWYKLQPIKVGEASA